MGEVVVCYLDLGLADRGDDIQLLSEQLSDALIQIQAEVVRTRKSASIRLEVPLISKKDYDDGRIRDTLHAWACLFEWWLVVENY